VSYFDAITLAAVADELRATVLNGRIQRVLLPTALSIALEIYAGGRRHHVLLSAHPRLARVQLSAAKPSRGVTAATPLLLLLRKYVNGGRIVAIEQPPLERVILLSIAKRVQPRNFEDELPEEDEHAEPLRSELIAEVMDQRSNIVLVSDENIVLSAVRRVTPQMSRRPIMAQEPYELPPPQEKRDPRLATAAGIAGLLEDAPPAGAPRRAGHGTLWRALVGAYRGLSPLAAREAVFRAIGDAEAMLAPDMAWEAVAQAVRDLWSPPWSPSLVEHDGQALLFAPYMLTSAPGAVPQPSIGAALDAFYSTHERLSDHQQRRDALRARLQEARERLERQRAALASELEQARNLERLRWEGEMIFAYLHAIRPRQAELSVEDQHGQPQTIQLDPGRSAVENAQERFRAYDKAKAATAGVPERLRAVELRLAGLDQTLALLELAEGFEAIELIAAEAVDQGFLQERGPAHSRKRPRAQVMPLRLDSSDGLTIYVGRSAGQNEMVTFKLGAPGDLWLHAREIPGAHVLVKSMGREIPQRTIEEAAGLAAFFSRARDEGAVEIDFAPRSQVRRIRGGPPGLVSYHAAGTLRAEPRPPW
jgi:predicted ribosome quality control (RQC) complex YloA/Tae2 family protein